MAEFSSNRFFRYLTLKLKSFFFSKDVLSFLVFLVLSATFWFVNALDDERELTMKVPVIYSGVPANIKFANELPKEVKLKIKDLGSNLWYYITNKPKPVEIQLNQVFLESGLLSVSNARILSALSDRLLPSSAVLKITPDNMVVKYHKLHTRLVPVQLNSNVSLEEQYMLCYPIEVIPSSIEVYGPRSVLDTIKSVQTEVLEISKLKSDITKRIALQKHKSLIYAMNEVTVNACAEMFTEKTAELAVQIINNPENLTIRSFPAVVKATFNIKMANFRKFENSDIQVVIDYAEINSLQSNKKHLKIINNKDYISNIRIVPQEVEFILEKK